MKRISGPYSYQMYQLSSVNDRLAITKNNNMPLTYRINFAKYCWYMSQYHHIMRISFRRSRLPLSFLSWAYALLGVYFWEYDIPGCRFSAFSYAKPSHFPPTRNDEDVSLHCMFEIVRSYMNGRFSVIPGKDVTIENLGNYQTKPTSTKLFHTQWYI